jgi:8-oxo-dGTP diphosphatase
VSGDGNGWVFCSLGHRHWGRFGAAGILITDGPRVVLQHRAAWTHEGDTWALPGGARDSHEDPVAAALREAVEETTVDPAQLVPFAEWIDDHGGWSYTTVLARTATPVELSPANAESVAITWWSLDDVDALPLHTGFAAAWPHLRRILEPV